MPEPFLRIDLSPAAIDFRPVIVQAGLPILDRWGTTARLLCDWLGRFAAEPVLDGETVVYYVTDDRGGRLAETVCQPATAAELCGPLRGELAALQERLRHADPTSASGRTIHQFVCRELLEGKPEELKDQWFKYRDPSGAWQLVWCAGYRPVGERGVARPVICSNPQCRQLALVNPRQSVACERCGAWVPPRSTRIGRWVCLAASLLLLLGAAVAGLWYFQPTLGVRVVRALDGQPIPDARVWIDGTDREIVGDSAGAFRREFFPALPGTVTLRVAAPGFREQMVEGDLAFGRETRIEVSLDGAGTLRGQVACLVGAERVPVAKALARVLGVNLPAAESDEEGRFRWDALPPGPVEVEVAAPGYARASVQTDVPTATPVEILLTGNRILEGRVVYAAEPSRPIAEAEVRWADSETAAVSSEASGRFSLSAIPPLPVRIRAVAPGFRPQTRSVPPDAPATTIPLSGDAAVYGVVTRGDTEQPVANVEVLLDGTPFGAVTDQQGRFRCGDVRSGAAKLLASAPGMSAVAMVELPADAETEVLLVLTGGTTLRGKVVNAKTRQPVPGATVAVPQTRLSSSSNDGGDFVLPGVPTTEVTLRVTADGFVSRDLSSRLADDEHTFDDIALTALLDVQGEVVRAVDGQPVVGATVAIAAPRITDHTGQDGRFRLAGVPQRPLRLGVLAEGYASRLMEFEPDDQVLRVELVGGAAIQGRIINQADRQPLAGATVAVAQTPWKTVSDEAGRFALEGVVAAPAALHFAAVGFAPRSLENQLATGAQDLGDIALVPLPPPAEPRETMESSPAAQPADSVVSFFGIQTRARSVGFVVDCSGSMGHARMQSAKAELMGSIVQLNPGQRFYATFFHDTELPMSEPPRALVPASLDEKTRFFEWQRSIEAWGGTNPEPSLLLTAEVKPDAIYLLSDGVFSALHPSTFERLAAARIVVHTVAFEDQSGAATLREIAEKTGGTYRFVPAGAPSKDPELVMVEWLSRNLVELPPADARPFHAVLCTLSGGQDFGPAEDASDEERAAAAAQWNDWWHQHLAERSKAEEAERNRLEAVAAKEREAEAAERRRLETMAAEQSEAEAAERRRLEAIAAKEREAEAAERRRKQRDITAAEQLRLTGVLREQFEKTNRWDDPEFRGRVIDRLRRIVKDYPETEAAQEAQRQLRQLN